MHTQNLQVPAGSPSIRLADGACRILWHAFKETTGAAGASYDIMDGNAPDAKILLPVTLAANESTRDFFGPHGLEVNNAVFVRVNNGSIVGNITTVLEDEYLRHYDRVWIVEEPEGR